MIRSCVQEHSDIIYRCYLIIHDITQVLSIVVSQSYQNHIFLRVNYVQDFEKCFYLLEPIDPDLAHLMDILGEKMG